MAVDMFLNMGPTIKGETLDKAQKALGDIDILGWAWGLSSSPVRTGGGAPKASFQDISFTKYLDKASTALMMALAKGTFIPVCTLLVRKVGDPQQKYLVITLTKALVTSISAGGSGGEDRFIENVTINFAQVKVEYFMQDDKGMTISGGVFAWDIVANAVAP